MTITPLGFALIGLAVAEPRSGYKLRKVFETTPLGYYSSSPGSIYPVLRKLINKGLLEKHSDVSTKKSIYHATPDGQRILLAWLSKPVNIGEVADDMGTVLLRFAFLESVKTDEPTQIFLTSFERSVRLHLKNLRAFMAGSEAQNLSLHGQLAMQNGIDGYEAHLNWVIGAQKAFSKRSMKELRS